MSTRQCKHCYEPVATNARRCSHCGGLRPTKQNINLSPFIAFFLVTVVLGYLFWDDLGLSNDTDQSKRQDKVSRVDEDGFLISSLGIQDGAGIFWVSDRFGDADFSIPKPTAYLGKPAIQCVYSHEGTYFQVFYYKGSAYAGSIITKEKYIELEADSKLH